MSDYNWCHGPECHTQETQSRVRGSGTNKVLRTIKIKWGRYNYSGDEQPNIWDYFCNNRCLHDFLKLHATTIANIAPRREALETPIKVVKEKQQREGRSYNHETREFTSYPYTTTRTIISRVDND
jgi:hypothetical protein